MFQLALLLLLFHGGSALVKNQLGENFGILSLHRRGSEWL